MFPSKKVRQIYAEFEKLRADVSKLIQAYRKSCYCELFATILYSKSRKFLSNMSLALQRSVMCRHSR